MGTESQLVGEVEEPRGSRPASKPGIFRRGLRTLVETLKSLLFLAPLALIFDLAGYQPPFGRLFWIYGLLALPLVRRPRADVLRGASVLAAVAAVNAWVRLPQAAEVAALTFAHLWVWSAAGVTSRPLVQGILFYTLLYLFLFLSPLGYEVLERLTAVTSATSRWFTGTTLNLGYTYQNLGSILFFLCLSVHAWDRGAFSKLRTGLFLVIALLLNGLLSAVLIEYVNLGPELMWELSFRDLFTVRELAERAGNLILLVYPGLIFLAHALTYLILHHDSRPAGEPDPEAGVPSTPRRLRPSLASIAFAACAAVFLLLTLPPISVRPSTPFRMVMLNEGVVSFTKPDYGRYGRGAGGMYGFFPDYAGVFGCQAEVVTEIPEALDPDIVFVLTNVDFALTPEEHERIWEFVRSGGRLWVLGDHTFIKTDPATNVDRNYINDLLEPCHIRFNNDSAQLIPQGWFHSFRMKQGTAFGHLDDGGENRLAILVGASLDLAPPARPLIMGRYGYGDLGLEVEDPETGYIGDFEYQSHERLGDLVLVAGEQVGKGKVLVFGDTTSFFNNNLSRSYELLRAVLTWFGEPARSARFNSRGAGLLAAMAVPALLVFSVLARPAAAAMPTLLLLAVLSFAAHRPANQLPIDPEVARERVAVIDFSHDPYASRHGSMDTALYGLTLSIMRYDWIPMVQNRWDRELLGSARLLFMNAPRRPLSPSRRRDLMRFMERGGAVVLACGYHQYPNSSKLLASLGLRVRGVPLGRFFDRPALNRPVQYFSAWPIEVSRRDASVLSAYDAWPLMVSVPVGEGLFVLIADSEFFHNFNLESLERYSQQNIEFLRSLLDLISGRPST